MAFNEGESCPYCGLSAAAAAEVISASHRGADEALVESTAKAIQRADVAEREVQRLRRKLNEVRRLLDE
jgi:hypothetical protein